MQLLHHVDVVKPFKAGLAPAHVLEAAGHVFLPVEVVGRVARLPQTLPGKAEHIVHVFRRGQRFPGEKQVRALFQGQGVDGDVGGAEGEDLFQRIGKGGHRVRRQAGDQIHVDALKTGLLGVAEGPHRSFSRVAAADDPQHLIVHGLGVDAHAVTAQGADGLQLGQAQGVRAAALYRIFYQACQVKIPCNFGHQPFHLFLGQGGGGAAADVEGSDPFAAVMQELSHMDDLLLQGVQKTGQEAAEFFNARADKAAIGAAGGAEGDADIEGNVIFFQQTGGLDRGAGGLDAQPPPFGQHMILLLEQALCAFLRAAGEQMARGQLGGPHAGQASPGRRLAQLHGRRVIGILQQSAAAGHVTGQLRFHAPRGISGLSVEGDLCPGSHPVLAHRQGRHGTVTGKRPVHRLHGLIGKQGKLELLHGIALGMSA